MSLKGKTILVTRSKEQAEEFVRLIENYGASPILFPTIEIQPPDSWQEFDDIIKIINQFDGIIFTSLNAVEKFFLRFKELNSDTLILKNIPIYTVGSKTKSEIENHNLKCELLPEIFTSESLAKAINKKDIVGKKFLFPRGNISKDTIISNLTEAGAQVVSLVVYKTSKPNHENIFMIEEKLLKKEIDVITFTSPSTVHNFFEILNKKFKNIIKELAAIAVIGPTTASTLRSYSIDPDIIPQISTIEDMLKSIEFFFNQSNIDSRR